MNLTISGHHIEITPSLRDHVLSKLQLLTHHCDHLIDATVLLRVDAGLPHCRHRVEATLHLPGQDVHAESCDENMYTAIDLLVPKLDRQVTKHKLKLRSHRQARMMTRDAGLRPESHDSEPEAMAA